MSAKITVPTTAMLCVRCGAAFGFEPCTKECQKAARADGNDLLKQ